MFHWLRRKGPVSLIPASRECKLLTPPGVNARRKKFVSFGRVPLIVTNIKLLFYYKASPMCRVIFDDGTSTAWHRYDIPERKNPIAIETCAPDHNGEPRFASLKIG